MSIKSEAIIIRDETTTGANTAARVGTNLVSIADDLIAKQSEIDLNTAKVGITTQQSTDITTNNAKVGITTHQSTDITTNNAKVGITTAQSSEITANNAKVGITSTQSSEITANNAKVGITSTQSSDITTNNAKVGYTESLVSANTSVVANTAKISFDSASSTKLGGIETGAEVNTINSTTTSEPTGSDLVYNVVSLTQAEYDAGSPVATTFYLIVG